MSRPRSTARRPTASASESHGAAAESDEALVAAILRGDDRCAELIGRQAQRVYRAARGILRDDGAAEDVAEEIWVRAFERLGELGGRPRFAIQVARMAVDEAIARSRRPTPDGDARGGSPRAFDDSPAKKPMGCRLENALDALPPKLRVTWVLRELERLDTRESAAVLDVTTTVVKVRLHRARAALRAALGELDALETDRVFPLGPARCDRLVASVRRRIARGAVCAERSMG